MKQSIGLDEAQLSELEDFAGTFLNNQELECVMGLEEGSLAESIRLRTPEGLAVLRGRIRAKAMQRRIIMQLALAGSAPAQLQMEKIMLQQQIDDV